MTINDIIALSNAGFTKEDILRLTAAPAQNTNIQLPAPAPAPAPVPVPVPTPSTEADAVGQILARMDSLERTIQYGNVLGSQQPIVNQPTADDMLAKIINPFDTTGGVK